MWRCRYGTGSELWGIGLVGGYGAVGDRVCDWHQNILKLMCSLIFFTVVNILSMELYYV